MLNFHEHATANNFNTLFHECQVKLDNDSKIPFLFAAIPHELFDKGLDPSTVGVYCGLARYVNWKAQMTVDGRKIITGWTVPVTQETLADLLNTSRQTIIRKIKVLEQAGVIEFKKSFRGCYQYRLIAYKEGILELQQQEEERRKREQDGMTHPGVPTPEEVENYIKAETKTQKARSQTHQSDVPNFDTLCNELRHIKEMLRDIKSRTLSSGDAGKKEEPQPETEKERVQEENLKEYEKYATAFYGTIKSKKFLKDVCLYFRGKVEEFGFASDGTDRTMQVIGKVKAFGGKTHVALDKEFGARAFRQVLDEEEKRLMKKRFQEQQQKQKEARQKAGQEQESQDSQKASQSAEDAQTGQSQDCSSSPDNQTRPSDEMAGDEESTETDRGQTFSSDSNDSGFHFDPKETLRELLKHANPAVKKVAAAIESRTKVVKATGLTHYQFTEEQIERMWQSCYDEQNCWPENAGDWFHDRFVCNEILKCKGLAETLTNEQASELLQRAKQYEKKSCR